MIQKQYLRAMVSYWANTEQNPVSDVYGAPMVDMSRAFVWAWDVRPYPYFPNNAELWSDGDNFSRGHWLNGRTSARSLSSVVAEVCRRAGVMSFDVSSLYGTVRGYVVSDVSDARSALQPLMLRYAFDAVERDGTLMFRMRTGQQAVPLDRGALALSEEFDGRVEQTRSAEAEMAGRVRLRFVQADAAFDVLAEEAVLADEETHSVSTSEMPIVLTRAEGRQTAERWLSEARVAREAIRFALPPSRMSLGAGDVITLSADQGEGAGVYRIDRVEQGAMQLIEAVRIEPEIYVPSEMPDEPINLGGFVPPVPVTPLFLDLPLITGDEVPHAPYVAATAQPWPGSVALYHSSGSSDFVLDRTLAARSAIGITESAMQSAPSGRFDHGAPLQVKMANATLSSADIDAILAGQNLAAIGDGSTGRWELFQFADAQLIAPKTYALSTRLRGQLGTDALVPDVWPAGSWVVLMNGAPEQTGLTRNLRRVSQTMRIGPARRPVSDPSYVEQTLAFDGNGLRPYAPVHLVTHLLENGDVSVSWIRRTRIDGDGWDSPEVPLGEETESYVVQVRKDGAILREIQVSQPQYIYSASDQLTDGISSPFDVEVAQISASYGPGLQASVTVTP